MIKELVVVSGKGGTGKTSICAALASIAEDKVLVDADVDAANLHLLTGTRSTERNVFMAGYEPEVNLDKCNECGVCTELCRYRAIDDGVLVDALSCEGCGVCAFNCPEHAINMLERQAGEWLLSETRFGCLVHAELGIAVENSGKLVSRVRQVAREKAKEKGLPLIIIDGPPGIGCSAIASLTGAHLVLAVVEPTVSGIHDLKRLYSLTQGFSLPMVVCINKCDLSVENVQLFEDWCRERDLPIIAKLKYSRVFPDSLAKGLTITEVGDVEIEGEIQDMWSEIAKRLDIAPLSLVSRVKKIVERCLEKTTR